MLHREEKPWGMYMRICISCINLLKRKMYCILYHCIFPIQTSMGIELISYINNVGLVILVVSRWNEYETPLRKYPVQHNSVYRLQAQSTWQKVFMLAAVGMAKPRNQYKGSHFYLTTTFTALMLFHRERLDPLKLIH